VPQTSNVIFFTRGQTDRAETSAVWVYDLRANMPAFGKTHPLSADDFVDFERAFGDDPYGKAKRIDQGEQGRFRCFTREQIEARGVNLAIGWLQEDDDDPEDQLIEPEDIAAAIMVHLRTSFEEIEGITDELDTDEQVEAVR
jgi:type I restriction enzyme M protein